MDDREVPHYFICPISLQIMKDPVTVATGITYDRENIQRWQFHGHNNTCPVTNQPLPIASDFIPNHNLRRLIQAWHVSGQVLTNHSPSQLKVIAGNLLKNLQIQELQLESLKTLINIASESENNRVFLKEVGVVRAVVKIIVSCYQNGKIVGLKEALNVLYLLRFTQTETRSILVEYDRIINSLTWVLGFDDSSHTTMKLHAIVLLKDIINNAKSPVLERLDQDFFKTILLILQKRENKKIEEIQTIILEGLQMMLSSCTWPRNCSTMIQAGAIFELIELELSSPNKATTESIMGVLFHLCTSADGRAQFLGHAAGIAMITKRMGKVSQKVDERALMIISLVSKFSATDGVLQEMVRVGTVEKLCMVLQVNGRHSYPRDKAREILKRHSNVWKDSPCLDLTLLTRYPK